MSLKIEKMYAFISEDKDGNEGVVGVRTGQEWVPLVGADMSRVNLLIPLAQQIVNKTKRPIKILMFTDRKEINEIGTTSRLATGTK